LGATGGIPTAPGSKRLYALVGSHKEYLQGSFGIFKKANATAAT
jgi:hypothetical protein